MSLLMDALKKAETVKQERAQAQEEHPEAPIPDDPGAALGDLDASGLEMESAGDLDASGLEMQSAGDIDTSGLEMESASLNPAPADEDDLIPVLEDIEILPDETGQEGLAAPRTVSAAPAPPQAGLVARHPAGDDDAVNAVPATPKSDPDGPPQAGPVARHPAGDDGAVNAVPAMPRSDPDGPAQAGPDAQTRAANLFRAKAPVRPKPRRVVLWVTIALIAVLAAAGQGYRIWQAQTRPSFISSGSAVYPPPTDPAPGQNPAPPPPAEAPGGAVPVSGSMAATASPPITAAMVAGTPAASIALVPAAAVPIQDGPEGQPPLARKTENNPPQPAPSPGSPAHSQNAGMVLDSSTRKAPAPPAPKAPAPQPPAVKAASPFAQPDVSGVSRVKILRTHRPDPTDTLVASAYRSFLEKDLAAARQGYRNALENDPNQRDALAGLAAIAVAAGDSDEAGRTYARMLELNPHDALAQAGIMAYSADAPRSEARIKTMLDRQPQVPFLHFVLGNHYAAQSNWPSAQQAFFDALRLDPNNPDYAFNLAVSLEHLRQAQRAAQQYRKALDLSERRPFAFDRDIARARLEKLAEGRQP